MCYVHPLLREPLSRTCSGDLKSQIKVNNEEREEVTNRILRGINQIKSGEYNVENSAIIYKIHHSEMLT